MSDANGQMSDDNPTIPIPQKRRKPHVKADTWRPQFIEAFRNTGNARAACEAANISYDTAFGARQRSAEFRQQWEVARDEACDVMEAEAWRRAVLGTEKPVYHQGEVVGAVKEYSDVLLIFLLKANRPQKYRERVSVDVTLRREQLILAAREEGLDEADAVALVEEMLRSKR